jgi:hypothetical protein
MKENQGWWHDSEPRTPRRWVKEFQSKHPRAAKIIHGILVALMFLTFALGYGLLIWYSQ